LLPPPPLFVVQPLLQHVVTSVARRNPELFARLGDNCRKRFLIDPRGLPMVLLLQPDPAAPRLVAHSRRETVEHDVLISGKFTTLLGLIGGETDSDALFFNRTLQVSGDTEAMVALRNALDNIDATLSDDVAAAFGPLAAPIRALFGLTRKLSGGAT